MSTIGLGWTITEPQSAVTLAQGSATGGLNGTYTYAVSFVNSWGETVTGTVSGALAIVGTCDVTNIPIGPGGTLSRRLYRTVASGTVYKLVTTIGDNTTTTYNDALADGSLGANALTVSTAHSHQTINGYTSFNMPIAHSNQATIVAVAAGTAPTISSENNVITTSPLGSSVTLAPISVVGLTLNIRNNGANPCLIVPSAGNTINSGASLALANGAFVKLFADTTTNWTQLF